MKKCRTLMKKVRSGIISECERLLNSGAVDPADYDDNFRLAKEVMTAALRHEADQWAPLPWDNLGQKVVRNLSRM